MQNSKWQKVKEIFFEAVELEESKREEFLNEKCQNDSEIYQEIKELLAEHIDSQEIFEKPVFNISNLLDPNENGLSERQFGKYKIKSEIATGGMGTVFLGERSDGEFDQQVAIKISRQTIADEQTV